LCPPCFFKIKALVAHDPARIPLRQPQKEASFAPGAAFSVDLRIHGYPVAIMTLRN